LTQTTQGSDGVQPQPPVPVAEAPAAPQLSTELFSAATSACSPHPSTTDPSLPNSVTPAVTIPIQGVESCTAIQAIQVADPHPSTISQIDSFFPNSVAPAAMIVFPGQQQIGTQATLALPAATTSFPVTEFHQHHTGIHQQSLFGSGLQENLTFDNAISNGSFMAQLSDEGGTIAHDNNWVEFQRLMGPEFNDAAFLGMTGNHDTNEIAPHLDSDFSLANSQNENQYGLTPHSFMPTPLPAVALQPPPLSFDIQSDNIAEAESGVTRTDGNAPSSCVVEASSKADSSAELGSRTRKPTGPKEVIPLTAAKVSADALPVWLAAGLSYLSKGIEDKSWTECLQVWIEFEKQGLSDIKSVSPRTKQIYLGSQLFSTG